MCADHATLVHDFISAVADLAGSVIKPSDWNHGHKFQGGVDGNLLVKDSTQTDGVLFKDPVVATPGRLVDFHNQSQSYSGASPSGDLVNLSVTLTVPSKLLLIFVAGLQDSAGSLSGGQVQFKRDTTTIGSTFLLNNQQEYTSVIYDTQVAGTYVYKVNIQAAVGPIVSCTARVNVLIFT